MIVSAFVVFIVDACRTVGAVSMNAIFAKYDSRTPHSFKILKIEGVFIQDMVVEIDGHRERIAEYFNSSGTTVYRGNRLDTSRFGFAEFPLFSHSTRSIIGQEFTIFPYDYGKDDGGITELVLIPTAEMPSVVTDLTLWNETDVVLSWWPKKEDGMGCYSLIHNVETDELYFGRGFIEARYESGTIDGIDPGQWIFGFLTIENYRDEKGNNFLFLLNQIGQE
jgi:hypothetical protein